VVTQHPRAQGFLAKEPSRFVGRAVELEELSALSTDHSRLVTITGPAGIGKTRLALRHASARRFDYQSAGGVWFVELSAAHDVDGMCAAVLATLRISDQASGVGEDAATAVGRALAARRRTLIVLDNVEQLLPHATGVVMRWLDDAPEARFVITSREVLGVAGEEVLALSSLCIPEPGSSAGEAVDLFVERVRSVRGRYAPGRAELHSVAEVVRHLLGVPLAIELAASRLEAGEPEHLLRPTPLGAELRTAGAARLRTPRQALDWGWGLLSRRERDLLSQCSVFRGGFTLEAAVEVVDLGSGGVTGGRSPPDDDASSPAQSPVVSLLQSLHKKCLLGVERRDEEAPRFGMCEGIRAHAAEMLVLAPDPTAASWRHARYYLELCDRESGAGALTRERENVAAILELGASAKRPELVLRAAIALDAISSGNGLSRSQLARLDDALCAASSIGSALVGRALGVRAGALRSLGRLAESERDARMALALALDGGELAQAEAMHVAVGMALFQLGDLPSALEQYEQALEITRELGDRAAESAVLQQLGAVHQSLGRISLALMYDEAALALAVEMRDRPAEARASMGLGSYHLERGELDRARAFYERGFFLARELDMQRSLRIVTGYLGILHFDEGLLGEAERHLESAVSASKSVGDIRVEGVFVGLLGAVLAAQDRVDEARAHFVAAESLLSTNEFFRRVVAIHRGHLDLAEARQARADHDPLLVEKLLRSAHQRIDAARGDGTPPLVQLSDDARIAIRILERALEAERSG